MAATTEGVDMELKKAFQELQLKMVQTQQQVKVADMQSDQLRRQIIHTKIVQKEIETLPKETRLYEGVGRMFVLQSMGTVQTNLEQKISTAEEKITSIQNKKNYLERDMKDSESSLRELVMSKQQARS